MKKTNVIVRSMGWAFLVAGLWAGVAQAQLPVLAQQTFEDKALGTYTPVTTWSDGWVSYRGQISTNRVPSATEFGNRVGYFFTSNTTNPTPWRYWSSSAVTGNIGVVRFSTMVNTVGAPTNTTARLLVAISDTAIHTNNNPATYTVLTNMVIAATNWTQVTIPVYEYGAVGRRILFARPTADNGYYALNIDNIEVEAAPATLTATSLGLVGGGTSRTCDQTLTPILAVTPIGTVPWSQTFLWHRYSGGTYSAASMNKSGNSFTVTLPAGNQSNRQLEMYAVLSYSNETGYVEQTFPAGGTNTPVRIDILPVSANASMQVQGGLSATLALATNSVWTGGLERESGVTGPTYHFVAPGSSWGSLNALLLPPYRVAPMQGAVFILPSPASLTRDLVFGFVETLPTEMSAQYGDFQTFENWGVTAAHGWTQLGTTAVTNNAALAHAGSTSVRLNGTAGDWIQSPARIGAREVGFWFRRADTNTVTVTVQKMVGAAATTIGTFTGLPSDLYTYGSVMVNDVNATGIRFYANAPTVLDDIAVTDMSSLTIANDTVVPNPVMALQEADLTVDVIAAGGAQIGAVTLSYRYGTTGPFSDVSLLYTNGLYSTRSSARIGAAPDASQDLQYYVTAAYDNWDGTAMTPKSTATNTVQVIPFSAWDGLSLVNNLSAPMHLATNQYWRGAVLVTTPVVAPTFWFLDTDSVQWGSTAPKMPPAFGTATNGVHFGFTNTVAGSLAFSFDEATRGYVIQSAEYEPFEGGVHQAGWSSTNLLLSATPALQGQAAQATAAAAVVVSPTRAGIGEVSFWARMATGAASSTYTVEIETSPGVWQVVPGGTGTVSGNFYRFFRVNAGDPVATRARVRFGTTGVLVDDLLVTAAGAYVALTNPLVNGAAADTNTVPVVAYAQSPNLGVTATAQNGAANVQVRVAYVYETVPSETNYVTLVGSSSGGSFTNKMPALAVGTNRYWYVADFSGMNAAQVRLPQTGYFRYATDGALGADRKPDPVAWATTVGSGYINNFTLDGWNIRGVWLQQGAVQIDAVNGERLIRSPSLNGIGSVYFKAKPAMNLAEVHQLAVEVATSSTGPWTAVDIVTVPVGLQYTSFRVTINDYRNPIYVRIRRVTGSSDVDNRLSVKDIVITPPPSDIVLTEPSIITPGYPSRVTPVTFQNRVLNVSSNYPASNFQTKLVWQWGTNAWVSTPMVATSNGYYAVTLPAMEPERVSYYTRVDFTGPSYTYVDGTNVYQEGRSPTFLGTNNVQTALIVPSPKQFRVRMFNSNHANVELQRYDTSEYTTMTLVGEHTWQAVLYLTNAVNMNIQFAGLKTYTPAATAYGADQFWGDANQDNVNPPLSGNADQDQQDILVDINYVGFVMFRFNVTNGLYQVRRAAFQDFDEWPGDDVYFEESLGLFAIKDYLSTLDSVPVSTPSGVVHAQFNTAAINPYDPPYSPPLYRDDWRLENAWIIQERVAATNLSPLASPANRAVRINAGPGTLQSTPELHTRGRDSLTLRHRVAFGDENTPYQRYGFVWSNYVFSARAAVAQISPANPTLSLIGYYYDRDNFYELRLTQERVAPASNSTDRVVGQMYRKTNGTYTALAGATFTTNGCALTAGAWDMAISFASSGSSVTISARAGVAGVTNTIASITDGAAGVLAGGGSLSFNVYDTLATFSNLSVVNVVGGAPLAGFSNNATDWYLGGQPLGGSGTRWVYSSQTLSRPIPTVNFEVGVVRTGESTAFPGQAAWTAVGGTQQSLALDYVTLQVPLTTWDYTFLQIRPSTADGMLVVDDLYTRDWRGMSITDPTPVPVNDPLTNTVWRANEAYVTMRSGSHMLELTRSRANPALRQMITSPVLDDGVGTISFNYQVSGGPVQFAVERTSFDGLVEDDDPWELVSTVVSAPSGTIDDYYMPVRTNMIGRVRVRLLAASDPAATLWLDNLHVTSSPKPDNTTWTAYNALINRPALSPDVNGTNLKQFERDDLESRTAFLNNSPTLNVTPLIVLNEDQPFIQSPQIDTGIGEIGLWFRAWNPADLYPGKLRLMKGPSPDAPLEDWTEVTLTDPVADAAYKARLNNITNASYEYISIEIFDKDNHVLRVYGETNQAGRVAVDHIIVTEPVRSSIDILSVLMAPLIPLADDPVGVEVLLGNPRMNPQDIRVFLDYYLGTNKWGTATWGANPAWYSRVELTQSPSNRFLYASTDATCIPAQPIDAVVQYRVVVTYTGTFASPIEYNSFTNPDWYEPIDLNAQYQSSGFAPYYFVFSCPTGTVFINEFFYAWNAAYNNREFVEVLGPRNASIAKWRLDVVDAAQSALEDHVTTSYTLPANAYLAGGTNGWGFYTLGDTDAAISNRVSYFFPDGGDPLTSPATDARLPTSGGFRLVRSMGAYADRISYGTSTIASDNMVTRGYTYTFRRGTLGSTANRAIGLSENPLTGTTLSWQLVALGGETPSAMNAQEANILGEITPFPDPIDPTVPQAALTLAITDIQLSSGAVMVTVWAESTNEVLSLAGWSGVLLTNGSPTASGWGTASVATAFSASGPYVFTMPDAAPVLFYRIKAANPDAP